MSDWSSGQRGALDAVPAWYKSGDQQIFRLFGYAGTGKTTLAKHFVSTIKGRVCFAAYTGKAALMMRKSGCFGAQTIHSLIYRTIQDPQTGKLSFIWNEHGDASTAAIIVIDEASFVDEKVGSDLMRYGKPILVLGDPFQLPPVKGAGFFTEQDPDFMLDEIHRQAESSPVVTLATNVRTGKGLALGAYGSSAVVKSADINRLEVSMGVDQVIVGKNITRDAVNRSMRSAMDRESPMPEQGDRVVCLKNDKDIGIFNGGIFEVSRVLGDDDSDKIVGLEVESKDFESKAPIKVRVRKEFFCGKSDMVDWKELRGLQQFDYGYALTGHKSQGSQWDHVAVFDESACFRESSDRWLYTAITRASESVVVIRR